MVDGEPWFVAKDVCDILGIQNARDTVKKLLDDDEKGVDTIYVRSENGVIQQREVNIVSESGLYHLIFVSRKPEAKTFRKWVTKEVLPNIRKHGFYMTPETAMSLKTAKRTRKQMLELTEDAYSPSRETQLQIQQLELPVVLDSRRETVYLEQTVPGEANVVTDVRFLPDFPRQRRGEAGVELTVSGTCQVLYYGEDGALQSGTARWENQQTLGADENSQISVQPILQEEPQAAAGAGAMTAKWELPLEVTAFADQSLPMVTGLELGEPRKLDPNRPSLILCRSGEQRLWDIAKASNATLDAIRQANDLAGEPAPNQILLIPIA